MQSTHTPYCTALLDPAYMWLTTALSICVYVPVDVYRRFCVPCTSLRFMRRIYVVSYGVRLWCDLLNVLTCPCTCTCMTCGLGSIPLDTKLLAASAGKLLTATAIMRLVERRYSNNNITQQQHKTTPAQTTHHKHTGQTLLTHTQPHKLEPSSASHAHRVVSVSVCVYVYMWCGSVISVCSSSAVSPSMA